MASGSGINPNGFGSQVVPQPDEIDAGDILDAVPVDARDGLIQVVKVPKPWKFAVQYAPGSDEEMVKALEALEKKFPTQSVRKYKTLVVLSDKE